MQQKAENGGIPDRRDGAPKGRRFPVAPGLTPRSLMASIFGMVLAGIYTQYSMVYICENNQSPEQVLPVPAMAVLLLLVLLGGGLFALFKKRILTRAETLCVVFAMFIAVPLMTQGFWHRFLGLVSVPLRTAGFDYLDAFNDNLWPHGPNLLSGRLAPGSMEARGAPPVWSEVAYEVGRRALLPRLSNSTPEAVSSLSVVLPMRGGGPADPGNPHLLSILARTAGMETESAVFCRVHVDDSPTFNEVFTSHRADRRSFLHKLGFERLGVYGVSLAERCREQVRIEFGLRGRGEVVFADPKLMSVLALEGAFRGRKRMLQSEYEALPEDLRPAGVVIEPDRLWSAAGLLYLLKGHIPLREWMRPAAVWSAYVLLLCGAFLAVNIIMRRRWAEVERYPLPNTRIPLLLIGAEDPDERHALPAIWRNRQMWAGFAVALAWGLLKGWHAYNPRVPDLTIDVALGPYFQNPVWGGMFNVNFVVSAFIVSIAVFFELNVLISFVIGFWIARSVYLIGYVTDLKVNTGYPWRDEQTIGAYLGYFLIVIVLSRKYLWGVLKSAARGEARGEGEVLSHRAALLLLAGCHLGVLAWARAVNASALSMMVYFCFMVLLGFVTSKLRAECGMPFGYFTPYNAMLLVSACGGIAVFGAEGMMVALILSGFLTVTVFFLIPGMQFELIQVGKRMGVQPRHLLGTCLIGALGGLLIGGWVFLSNAYAYGGDNIRFQWAFNGLDWFMAKYRVYLGTATSAWLRETGGAEAGAVDWGRRTALLWGAITMVLTLLRQFFAGFWFHPIGFIVGSSPMNSGANWGSLLVAWAIRGLVLKIGGATAVRHRLQPFFAGVFLGALTALLIFAVVNSFSVTHGSTNIYRAIP